MKEYTLGFVFDASRTKVLLMHKTKPDWQAGKLNGLGGKVEAGEDGRSCITREVQEESGLIIKKEDWMFIGTHTSSDWNMEIYTYVYPGSMTDASSQENEAVEWIDAHQLPSNSLSNIRWLIPLSLDKIQNPALITCDAVYDGHT